MAQITIGGEAVSVSLESYVKLKRAWKFIAAAQGSGDFVTSMDAIIGTIAVGTLPPRADEAAVAAKIDEIEAALKPTEIAGLKPFMNELLIEAGLVERTPTGE